MKKIKDSLIGWCPDFAFPSLYSLLHKDELKAEKIWLLKKDRVELFSPTSKFVSFGMKNFEGKFERFFDIQKSDVCLDVGACIGDTTVPMMIKAKYVIAVEPEPRNIQFLTLNTAVLGNVEIMPIAISNSKGMTNLHLHNTTTGHSLVEHKERKECITVPCDTLDNLFIDRHVDFAKIDVQGAEVQVLEGAKDFLCNVKKLVVETHNRYNRNKTYPDVLRFLNGYNFRVKFCLDNGLVYAWK